MREKLPVLMAEDLIRVLEGVGFVNTRRSGGSHFRYCHADGHRTTVPVHSGRTIGRGLLRKILRDVGMTVEELQGRLRL